ncbi:ASCH domain-containing protein [Maribacter algarum]|uniref:ASCH domain-containing protein n=1 Tax=Maribacter algarum (ex Zhang et al. 2020) TaxID=2578118 RepID=A0A5S3PW46_9FLAO|nr:ASCH domain-containing protein [Maribacter algarum]TMM59219.1 ASCH domain-containing protein [Maribacter algarum]
MKHIFIILFLILASCKSEPKTEVKTGNGIDQSVSELWESYTSSNPELKTEKIPEAWFFHNNREDANRLAALVVKGKKKASSGLYAWYKEANADLPKVGTKHIITDFDGKAQAIIEIKKVDTIPFNKISEAFAEMDMGTNIKPLKKWKKAHWDFFSSALQESGEKPTEEMLIVCESFETIWTEK